MEKMMDKIQSRFPHPASTPQDGGGGDPPHAKYRMFMWGGTLHRLPKGYTLTKVGDHNTPGQVRTAQQAYVLWHCPDRATGIGPLRLCRPGDFSDPNQRKRFSDWKRLCRVIDRMGRRQNRPARMTELEVLDLFQDAAEIMLVDQKFWHTKRSKQRPTRPVAAAALKVSTVLNDCRVIRKSKLSFLRLMRVYKMQGCVRRWLASRA